jgi:hypothetical protein
MMSGRLIDRDGGACFAPRQGNLSGAWMQAISIKRVCFAVVRLSDPEYMHQLATEPT